MRTHLSEDVFDKKFYPKRVFFYDFVAQAKRISLHELLSINNVVYNTMSHCKIYTDIFKYTLLAEEWFIITKKESSLMSLQSASTFLATYV